MKRKRMNRRILLSGWLTLLLCMSFGVLAVVIGYPVDIQSLLAGAGGGSTFEVDYLDVGQADAALVRCDGHYMLIDGGNADDSRLIYSYLKENGISYLDYVVCTHAHEDHVGGLAGALNYAKAGKAYAPVAEYDSRAFQSFVKYLNRQNKAIIVPKAGTSFRLGSARVTVLGPLRAAEDHNDMSLVLRIVYGNTSFLFTGDAGTGEEQDILNSGAVLKSDVLKVAHHGSDSATGYRWLREIQPAYAVISVGTGNSYGHPTAGTLSKLRDAGVTVYRTDLQGSITARSDGKQVTFTTERNAGADTLAEAGAGSTTVAEESVNYVLNTRSKKFHYPTCSGAVKMSERNKAYASDRATILAMGYEPCGICRP